jgi:ABC-type branched-subunit amino acid transport system substrate-binding protein
MRDFQLPRTGKGPILAATDTRNTGNVAKMSEQQTHEREVHMKRLTRRTIVAAAPAALAFGVPLLAARPVRAAKQYGPGVTDSEIKIGNTGPYSGPLSNASPIPISMAAYFTMINEEGGVNGRKITFISDDDGYSPPKTVEMTRKSRATKFCSSLARSAPPPTARSGIT